MCDATYDIPDSYLAHAVNHHKVLHDQANDHVKQCVANEARKHIGPFNLDLYTTKSGVNHPTVIHGDKGKKR